MAETHRRVEPRGVVGTGMLNDPDRLRDIEQRADRFMRDRNLPKKKFGEVISTASSTPGETELVDEQPQPDRRRKNQQAPDDAKAEPAKAAEAPKAATFERRPPRGVGVIRPSAAPPRSAQKPAASTTPPPAPAPAPAPEAKKADEKSDKKPFATGSRTPEQSKQTGGHTQVTFKI